jgi:hypothetical protein
MLKNLLDAVSNFKIIGANLVPVVTHPAFSFFFF